MTNDSIPHPKKTYEIIYPYEKTSFKTSRDFGFLKLGR
jgi:hypothetical protein